jgi:hypothetical protein
MLRRKQMPAELQPAWEAFQAQAERVETARQALLSCLPVGRVEPAPIEVGLDLLRDELAEVEPVLADWRVPAVEERWQACREAMAEAVEAIPEAHHVAGTTGELEELLDAVADVVAPLDAWLEAERHWLRLRTRPVRA